MTHEIERPVRRLPALLLALLAAGCGAAGTPGPDGAVVRYPTLIVVNKSQFVLEQLYLHRALTDYRGTMNQLSHPLAVEQETTFAYPVLQNGRWYVTVVREKVQHGALIAVTTGDPIEMQGGIYTLWVFDESFRLFVGGELPPPLDAGPPDLAADAGPGDGPLDASTDGVDADGAPADGATADAADASADAAGDQGTPADAVSDHGG